MIFLREPSEGAFQFFADIMSCYMLNTFPVTATMRYDPVGVNFNALVSFSVKWFQVEGASLELAAFLWAFQVIRSFTHMIAHL
jgi:hypothetical protein